MDLQAHYIQQVAIAAHGEGVRIARLSAILWPVSSIIAMWSFTIPRVLEAHYKYFTYDAGFGT